MNEQRATDTAQAGDRDATLDQSTSSNQAEPETPMDTRDLRDAQRGGDRKRRTETRDRPPIRAAGAATPPTETTSSPAATRTPPERRDAPLFDEAAGRKLRERWMTIQTEFVDEPRDAVQKADSLVAEVLKSLTDTFAREREELEAGWSGREGSQPEISTEDLRLAIQRYRNFFNRLLTY
jgi:hypothetical protein